MQIIKKNVNSNFFAIAVLFAGTRGITELVLGKGIAFAIQVSAIILFSLPFISYRNTTNILFRSRQGLYILIVCVITILSVIATQFNYGYFGVNYIIVLLFTFYLIVFSYSATDKVDKEKNYKMVIAIGFLLTLFALLQQLRINVIDFPGATADFGLIRPQSITGSFLHYPLILAIICSLSFIRFYNRVKLTNFLIFFYFFTCLITTLSRSGMLIVFVVIGYNLLKKLNVKTILIIILSIGFIFMLNAVIPEEFSIIKNRIFGATDIKSEGNDSRFELWMLAINMMSTINVLFGTNFGLVTNSVSEELSKGIVESSLLQQILNIGAIGTIFYYLAIFNLRKLLNKEYVIIFIACLLQTLIYQSIEVIPFIFLLITLPLYTPKLK